MPNHKADINQWTWYEYNGKKFVCTSAGWRKVGDAGEWEPHDIYLLELLTTEPKPISLEKMIEHLQSGAMRVIKKPY